MVKYEDMLYNLDDVLEKIRIHCNVSRNREKSHHFKMVRSPFIRFVLRLCGMQKSSAVLPGAGVSGEWQVFFTEDDKKFFKRYAGDLLVALGYENDNLW